MSNFEREDRYIVVKRSDLEKIPNRKVVNSFLASLDSIRAHGVRIPQRNFLVIEQDWPEYEPVWQMIEDRVTGAPVEGGKAEYDSMAKAMTNDIKISRELAQRIIDWYDGSYGGRIINEMDEMSTILAAPVVATLIQFDNSGVFAHDKCDHSFASKKDAIDDAIKKGYKVVVID